MRCNGVNLSTAQLQLVEKVGRTRQIRIPTLVCYYRRVYCEPWRQVVRHGLGLRDVSQTVRFEKRAEIYPIKSWIGDASLTPNSAKPQPTLVR